MPTANYPFRPHVRGIKWYEDRVAGMISMHKSGSIHAMRLVRQHHARFANRSDDEIRAADFTADDARLILAVEHGFPSWEKFKAQVESIQSGETAEPFTDAFDAIQTGNEREFNMLLQLHPDLVQAQGTNGSSLLNLAVSLRQPGICRSLILAGAPVDLATTRGVTPLHQAAYSNQPEMISMLIEAGARTDLSAYGDGGTPLVMALFWGHDAARQALAKVATTPDNLRVFAGVGQIDRIQACFQGKNLTPAAKNYRAFYRPHTGFPIWSPSDNGQEIIDEALVYAARNGQDHVLEFLLDMGADINGDPYRGTALVWAVVRTRINTVHRLLDLGADINHRGTFGGLTHGQGYTALHAAAESGRLDIVKLLVERGAEISIKDGIYHATAAGWAAHHGHPDVATYINSLQ